MTSLRPTRSLLLLLASALVLSAGVAAPATAGAFGQPMLSGGDDFSCSLNDSGVERCWGSSYGDSMGDVPDGANPVPVVVPGGAGAIAIANTNSTNCALIPDGTIRCWGSSFGGELGRGSFVSSSPLALPVTGIANATQLGAAAGGTFCARLSDGTAKCWGDGSSKQLGDGGTTAQASPVVVSGLSNVQKIVSGNGTTCALIVGGTFKCWGENADGEMGNNTSGADVAAPQTVPGLTDVVDFGMGNNSVCVLRATGKVSCWGDNFYGQLGNDDITGADKHVPTELPSLSGVKAISIGGSNGCALMADETVRCWGYADTGETGTGLNSGKVYTPTLVQGVTNVERLPETLVTGVCVMKHGGAVVCWGSDTYGATGLAPIAAITGPNTVPGLSLISPRAASAIGTFVTAKPKLDKKRKKFTLLGHVDATPDPIVLQSAACSGAAAIAGSYTVVTYKTTHKNGKKKRKKVTKTKKFAVSAPLAVVGNSCSGAFSVKLPAKTVAKKKIKLAATFPGNGAMLAFTAPVKTYTMPKLPKVKKKKH